MSAKNIAIDTISGNNIKDSVHNEVKNVRKRVADEFENVINKPKKRRVAPKLRKKKKKVSYANRYSDKKSIDWLSK